MQKPAAIFLFLILSLLLNAQTENTRLWRISGHGLQKPSYLYGSMHVDDARVFNFCDSLFYKMEECEYFANEVSNDSVLKFMYESIDNQFQERIAYEYFGEEEEAIEEVSNSTGLDKITLKKLSPVVLRHLIPGTSGTKERMPAMLDNYLYNIAKKEGKKCIGIENLNTQVNLFNQLSAEIRKEYTEFTIGKYRQVKNNEMIDFYRKGNLAEIETLTKNIPPDLYRQMFSERNFGMARQIDSISQQYSTFYTIGIGHLPGTEGLINLLRMMGYTVNPVKETFTGKASAFKFRNLEVPWVTYSDPKNGFTIDMPGQSYTSDNFPMGIAHGLHFDLGTNSFYMVVARPATGMGKTGNLDSLARSFAASAWKVNPTDMRVNRVHHNGIEFAQIDKMKMGQLYISFRLAIHAEILYLCVGMNSQEKVLSEFIRFFDSFKLVEKVIENWNTYHSDRGGFEVYFPGTPKENSLSDKNDPSNSTIINMISGIDNKSGNEFAVQYFDIPKGYYPNDTLVLSLIEKNVVSSFESQGSQSKDTIFQGFPARLYTCNIGNGLSMRMVSVVRSTRIYNLMSSFSTSKQEDDLPEQFLNSFRFKDYSYLNWKTQTSSEGFFSVISPEPFKKSTDDYFSDKFLTSESFHSFDNLTGDKTLVLRKVFSPFYFSLCDSSFFRDFYAEALEEEVEDSVISQIKTSDNPLTYTFITESPLNHLTLVSRFVLKGRSIYTYATRYPRIYKDFHPALESLESFIVSDTTSPGDLTTNKTSSLLADLSSMDTTIFYPAKKALSFYEFSIDERPLVWQTLYQPFSDDTIKFNSTREILLNSMSGENDSIYKARIINSFDTICPTNNAKLEALSILTRGFELRYRDFVKHQLLKIPANVVYKYRVLNQLTDSMEYSSGFYPEIMEMVHDSLNRDDLFYITSELLDNNILQSSAIEAYKPAVFNTLKSLASNPDQLNPADYLTPKVFYLAGFFNDEAINTFLIKNRNSDNLYIAYNILKTIIRFDLNPKKKDIERIAGNLELRRSLYDFLLQNHKTYLMPPEFNRQESMAASDLHRYLILDEIEPVDIRMTRQKDMMVNDTLQRFFLFRYSLVWDDEKANYFSIAGPYPTDYSIPEAEDSMTGLYWSNDESLTFEQHFAAFEKLLRENE